MTQRRDETIEDPAVGKALAGALVWSVSNADLPLAPIAPRAVSGRGVFVSGLPRMVQLHIFNPTSSIPFVLSPGPAVVAGPTIVL